MTTFTREQLAAVVHDRATVIHDGGSFSLNVQDLAAFALALLKRAEKAEAERDDANDERDDAVDRWARRAREAEATCKELLQVQDDRDRLRAQLDSILANSDSLESGKLADANAEIARLRKENKSLREANEIDLGEKAPLIFENAKLKARNEILLEELEGAEEVIRYVSMTDVNDCFLPNGHEMKGAYGFRGFLGDWYAYPRRMQAAVRRARERTEINKEQEDK